jgi:uncharacterized protein (DUF427 family)
MVLKAGLCGSESGPASMGYGKIARDAKTASWMSIHPFLPSTSSPAPMEARWKNRVIANSNDIVTVEGNAYFPADSLDASCIRPSPHRTVCGWKGVAHYYDVVVDGTVNANAAWFYPDPKEAAAEIKGRVAFWKGVEVG